MNPAPNGPAGRAEELLARFGDALGRGRGPGLPVWLNADHRRLAVAALLVELRAWGPAAGAIALAALELVGSDAAAEFERAAAELAAEQAQAANRATAADALRQVAALEADGGPSELSVAGWLAAAGGPGARRQRRRSGGRGPKAGQCGARP